MVFGLSDNLSTGGAQLFERDIRVIDVNPEAEAILACCADGASNEKAKRELGWELRYPSWRQGFRDGLD